MSLSADEVRKVARLARLRLTDSEQTQLGAQIGQILDYVNLLSEIDTTGVEPMAHAVEITNVFRPDVPAPSLPRQEALANAPKSDGKYFLVPPILEGA
jgi:aspartyl-tRNA(Asn)/glutamyl-tRNA(Gln) amidotransferase subunit C